VKLLLFLSSYSSRSKSLVNGIEKYSMFISGEFPEHGSTKLFFLNKLRLELDGSLIIITDEALLSRVE